METMKEKIDNFVNDLFSEILEEKGILYGDISPLELYDLDEAEENLARKILEIVSNMEKYNK